MLNSTPCLRVAHGGVKRPCKRERAFFLRKSSSQIGQYADKQNNELHSHTRPSFLLAPLVPRVPLVLLPCCPAQPYTPRSSHACIASARYARPSACGVPVCPRMPFPTARHGKHEKRHVVTKCQCFVVAKWAQIMEIMFSCLASRCVSVCNVLTNRGIVKWLDKRPFCGVRVWRSH